jgi:hypothetical protein
MHFNFINGESSKLSKILTNMIPCGSIIIPTKFHKIKEVPTFWESNIYNNPNLDDMTFDIHKI